MGEVYIDNSDKDNKAWIEVVYNENYKSFLDNYIDMYNKRNAICKLHAYQENIRFIMHLVNMRKSGITRSDEVPVK